MNGQEKMEKFVIAALRAVMRGRDLDVDIQPVGENNPETITAKSSSGEFKIIDSEGVYSVDVNGQKLTIRNNSHIGNSNYDKIMNIKNQCWDYRNKHYYCVEEDGKYIKLPEKIGFFARVFGGRKK